MLIAEIPEDLQQKAKRRVCLAMDKYDIEKDIATDVKKHFDEECEGSWHCVVRTGFTRMVYSLQYTSHVCVLCSIGQHGRGPLIVSDNKEREQKYLQKSSH